MRSLSNASHRGSALAKVSSKQEPGHDQCGSKQIVVEQLVCGKKLLRKTYQCRTTKPLRPQTRERQFFRAVRASGYPDQLGARRFERCRKMIRFVTVC
jgi:hypothetical protein